MLRMAASMAALGAALAAFTSLPAQAQSTADSGCISLANSSMCPSFSDSCKCHIEPNVAHNMVTDSMPCCPPPHPDVSPSNLSLSYPFFAHVSDVASFDHYFQQYYADYQQFRQTKLHEGLQCNETGSLNATLQWSQTVLCGQFATTSFNAGCKSSQNQSTSLVCRSTCKDYAESEHDLVANPSYCTPTSDLRPHNLTTIRNDTMENDFTSCTSWSSLYSSNNQTCVMGITNEGNCGWGPGTSTQLCSYCNNANGRSVDQCCYDEKTDLSDCAAYGYSAAAAIRPTTSIGPGFASSPTGDPSPPDHDDDDDSSKTHLSGGQLAGVIIGCVFGALLIGAFIAWLVFFFCCAGKRRRQQQRNEPESQMGDREGIIAGAARPPTTSPREKPYQLSEDTTRNRSLDQEKGPLSAADGTAAGAGAGMGAAAGLVGAGAMAASHSNHDGSANSRPLSTATSGTDGRGTTVPSVRCQYTGQDIAPGDTIVAIYPYSAGLSDELDLVPESHDELTVMRIYDDGWCLLRRPDGKEGAAPLVCCQSSKGELPAHMRMGGDSGTATGSGTTDDETSHGGATSGAEGGMTSSVGGAVTADEYGFTSDAASR